MARSTGIRIEGLREVRAELKELDSGFERKLKDATQRIANEVTDASQYRAKSEGGTAAFVAESIKSGTSVNAAVVRLGVGTLTRRDGTTVRAALVAPGAEFGSSAYRQFNVWRGTGANAGYFIYPTIRAMKPEITQSAVYEFEKLIKQIAPF